MSTNKCSLSVVIITNDNAQLLEENLPSYLQQVYEPGYEVIVVDECSTDSTEDVLKLLKNDYPHLYTTFLPRPDRKVTRRRMAFTIGAKAAKNDWIVLADIYHKPLTNDWLQTLSDFTDSTTELILGYVGKKSIRYKQYDSYEEVSKVLRKAERKKADGHKGQHLRTLRGKYDFIAVRRDLVHGMLKYFDERITSGRLLRLRLGVISQNLWQRSRTTKVNLEETTTE